MLWLTQNFFLKKLIFWNYFTQNSEIYNLTIRTANQNSNSVLIIIFIEDFLSTVLWVFRFGFKADNFLCLMVILNYFSSQVAFRRFSIILTLKRRLWSCIFFCGTEWVLFHSHGPLTKILCLDLCCIDFHLVSSSLIIFIFKCKSS